MKKAKETEIRAEVENLRSLDKDDLRARWCKMFGKEPPPALTKDLLGRMIAWRIQEKFYGGHDKATIKLLDGLVRGEAEKLEAGPKGAVISLRDNRFANPAGLVELIQRNAGTLKLRPDQRILYQRNWDDANARLTGVAKLVRALAKIARAAQPATETALAKPKVARRA